MEEGRECDSAIPEMPADSELREMISVNVICRLCANQNDKLIGIFSEGGINNELATKMNLYLPIKVHETDDLPLQCCWQCASTVLAWHELVVASVEADRRLRSYQFVTDKGLSDDVRLEVDVSKADQVGHSSLNAFCQTEPFQEAPEEEKSNVSTYILTNAANLTEFVTLEHPYITINNEIYNFKQEVKPEKVTSARQNEENDNDVEDESVESKGDLAKVESIKEEDKAVEGNACQFCRLTFDERADLDKHLAKKHTVRAPKSPKTTKETRKSSKIDQDVVNSAKVIINNKMYYQCKECDRLLHSPYTYVWHIRIHTGERPHSCQLCGKNFRVSQGLLRHIKETHQGIKNFPCDICGRMFSTKRNVEEHRRIHTNERPYVCDLCGKAFKQQASLFVHKRSHKDIFPFKCSYCQQGFRTRPPLLIHITKHTGEKPYPCDVCGRHFRIKYELKRHRLIHSDEKPFTCSLCGLSFKQKRYLRNHHKLNHLVDVFTE